MPRLRSWIGGAAALGLAAMVSRAADNKSDPKAPYLPVKKQETVETPQRPPETPEQPQQSPEPAPAAAVTPASTSSPAAPTSAPAPAPADAGPAANAVSSGQIAAAPSGDLGHILSDAPGSSGVEIQRRNAVVADPRVRGYRVGQLFTWGDHAFYFPARQDLDTALSKFEPGSVRDLTVIKGPYATRYGPGFAFLDIVTFDTPRAQNGCAYDLHGRTQFTYQSNGQRMEGLQSIEYGAKEWGFRGTYDIGIGNDYYDGDHVKVPSSYNSQQWSFAVGLDLSPTSSIEVKGQRLFQHDLEFAGLYFDIRRLDTEGYSTRYTSKESAYYDLFTADVWYNYTVGNGDTLQGYKQAFLSRFLPGRSGFNLTTSPTPLPGASFFDPTAINPGPGFLPLLQDRSTTRFADHTAGYRLASTWGKKDSLNFTLGTDFTYLEQGQTENIAILDPLGLIAADGSGVARQNLGLPDSNIYNPGFFTEISIPLNDRLSFRTGARADYARTTTSSRLITGNIDIFGGTQFPGGPIDRTTVDPRIFSSEPNNTEDSRNFGLWSAFLSSEYKFDDALTGLMGFGHAERAPTLTELYSAGPFIGVLQPGFDRLIGDPQLSPEKLNQFDVGLRGDYGWFKGSVSGFYAWINNYITYDRNKFGEGITQVVFTNTDLATLAGGEIYGQVEATSWLTPFASAAYVEGRDLTHRDDVRSPSLVSSRRGGPETEPLPSIPPLEIRSGLRVHESVTEKDKAPRWSVECAVRNVFDQNLVAFSLGELPTPGFTVIDLRAYWQADEHWTIATGVENIGDKNYREHLDQRAGDLLFRPGVNFYITTQLKY